MSVNREVPGTGPESVRLQESLAFLRQGRQVRLLRPPEVERIARRLRRRNHRPRRVVIWPAVITLGLVLVAGATFALAKGGLRSLPIVGPLLGPLLAPAHSTGESKSGKYRRPDVPKSVAANPPATGRFMVVPTLGPAVQTTPAATQNAPAPADGPAQAPTPELVKTSELPAHSVRPANPSPRTAALRAPEASHDRALAAQLPESFVPPPAAEEKTNTIVEESRSFASVIEPWHRTRDARLTLALLNAHERRFPSGYMHLESRVLRAEIYLTQGRESEALSVLDTLSLAGIPRARELEAVRGELRVKVGRCADGKRDLDDVLEKGVADSLAKRATQAISHCP